MTKQFTWRWVLGACCALIVMIGSRAAHAAAPMCDERGASAIAPAPVLPIRDVRVDVSAPAVPCPKPLAAVRGDAPAARDAGAPVLDVGTRDAWLAGLLSVGPWARTSRAESWPPLTIPVASGYLLGVFRPPRG